MHIGAGVRRRYRQLAKAIDAAVGHLLDRGDVQEILQRYGAIAKPQAPHASQTAAPVQATPSREEGQSVYATVCSRCHGGGGVAGGRSGVPTIRHYAVGQEKFLQVVQNGKKGTAMTPFKNILTVEEIFSVYQYLISLPHE